MPSHDVATFSKRIAGIAVGRVPVPGAAKPSGWPSSGDTALSGSDSVAANAAPAGDVVASAAESAGLDPGAVLYKGICLDTMSFIALRAACVECGLSGDGAKPRLRHRLCAYLESQNVPE